jgi:septal ring factor EnvC (AmiA/AmiB activator)
MNSNIVNSIAVGLMSTMAVWGIICLLMTVIEFLQNWLDARKNINRDVPALKTSVEELRKRQSRLETELEQVRRKQDSIGLTGPRERSAELPPRSHA